MKIDALRARCPHACRFLPRFSVLHLRHVMAAFVVLGLAFSVISGPVLAQNSDSQAFAQRLTQSLIALNARLQRAGAAERLQLIDELLELAVERQQLLMSLMVDNPAAVLRVALPTNMRDRLPDPVKNLVESKTELAGELQVLHVDYDDASHDHYVYVLKTVFGERFSLHFADKLPSLMSGVQVEAKGLLLLGAAESEIGTADGAVVVASGKDDVVVLAAGEDGSIAGSNIPPAGAATVGEQSTLVILVNFQDNPGEQPWTLAEAQNAVFSDTSDFFLENSFGQTWLNGAVVGWYTIAMDSTVCDYWGISSLANEAAAANGVDLSAYERLVYAFPRNSCSWGGLGTVGGSTSWSWLNGGMNLKLAGHEMGHNLGLWHSRGLECGVDIIEGSCYPMGYGDALDIMGMPNAGHFNAFQKERLGWLGYYASPPITTVEMDGTYTIEPYEPDGTGPKALKVLRSIDSATGQKTWYYVEQRQVFGFDAFLAGNTNVSNGVVIHRGTDGDGNSGFLLDMTPASLSYPASDFDDPALVVGKSFYDSEASVAITTEQVDGNGATMRVSMGPLPCLPANPSVSLSPSESQWVEPGTLVAYQVTVTNHDSTSCAPASFNLSVSVPAGWSAVLANTNLSLIPGAGSSTTLNVSSPVSAANGFYDLNVTVTNSVDAAYTDTAMATYVVSATLNQPPVAVRDDGTTIENTPVTIAVLVNDSDPDGDPLTVTAASNGSHGRTVINLDNTVSYMPDSNFSGTDSFTYEISDGNGGSSSAAVVLSVTGVNRPPSAVDDAAETSKDVAVTIDVLANDSDPDGDALSIASVTQGAKGTATINGDGTVTYMPAKGFKGDSFTYVVSDGASTASATVTITAAADGGGGGRGKGKP